MPGDACWPSTEDWTALNSSLSGKLIETVPLGSPCHDPTYVVAECLSVQQQWFKPEIQEDFLAVCVSSFCLVLPNVQVSSQL